VQRRKVIIVEGMDNVGKDTQIKAICNHFPEDNFHTLHYHAIKSRSNSGARYAAEQTYSEMFRIIDTMYDLNFILNRSHLGEYVYGPMYRNYKDPEYVFQMERTPLIQGVMNDAALLILTHNHPETLAEREDGDSLSQGQIELIEQERDRFYDVYLESAARHKLLLPVDGMSKEAVTDKVIGWLDTVYHDEPFTDD